MDLQNILDAGQCLCLAQKPGVHYSPDSGDFRGLRGEVMSLPLETLGCELSDSVPGVPNRFDGSDPSFVVDFAFSLPPFSFLNFLRHDFVRLKSPSPVSDDVALYSEHNVIRLLYSRFRTARAYQHIMKISSNTKIGVDPPIPRREETAILESWEERS